ncbi:MAG: helix-turn-helix domain-containing protein [Solirubrobacteraceae bacterium]
MTEAQSWRDRATLTVEETAPILGVGRSTAYVLARSGELPTLRLGRRFVVPVAALRRMLGETTADPTRGEAPATTAEASQKTPDAGGRSRVEV